MSESRDDVVEGLGKLVEYLRANPSVPVPTWGHTMLHPCDVDELAAVAQAPGKWNKDYADPYFHLDQDFGGGVTYRAYALRAEVCEPAETVTENVEIPDDEWLAARIKELKVDQPLKTVQRETVTKWNCAPLLGDKSPAAQRREATLEPLARAAARMADAQ